MIGGAQGAVDRGCNGRRAPNDGGGFGLGISIASQALETIGGKLTLSSDPGQGTRARVELPAAKS